MVTYSPWTWSPEHGRHYCYTLNDDGQPVGAPHWAGPSRPAAEADGAEEGVNDPRSRTPRTENLAEQPQQEIARAQPFQRSPPSQYTTRSSPQTQIPTSPYTVSYTSRPIASGYQFPSNPATNRISYSTAPSALQTASSAYGVTPAPRPSGASLASLPTNHSAYGASRPSGPSVASLPADVQAEIGHRNQRFIRTGGDPNPTESLDPRYRRVAAHHHTWFFVQGRVFKMLWTEPAGQANPGVTRGSTHFSTVMYGEQAYSEIRRFVVVRNRGTFSQCIPIQTYRGKGATKPGLNVKDHGVIYTSATPPDLLDGEGITKQPICVVPTAHERLEAESRVNYGKPYAVEHNVKVLDIGMIHETHKYMLSAYFHSAMRGDGD